MHLSSVLVLLGLFGAIPCAPLPGQGGAVPVHVRTLAGIVVDEKQSPVVSAELTVRRDGRVVAILRTSESGEFLLDNVGPGTIHITTRRIGFKALVSTLDLDSHPRTERVRIALETLPSAVSSVIVTSGSSRLDLFHQHRKEYASGRFLDREQIEKSGARLASDLFRSIPGASLRSSRRYGNTIRLRGCQPMVWIDRVPIRDAELDEVVVPEEIAGLEIYQASSGVPPQFMDRGGRSCGAIVVWTRIN